MKSTMKPRKDLQITKTKGYKTWIEFVRCGGFVRLNVFVVVNFFPQCCGSWIILFDCQMFKQNSKQIGWDVAGKLFIPQRTVIWVQNHTYILTTPPSPKNKLKCTDMSKHAGMHIHQLDNMKKKKENITVKSKYCRLDAKKCVRLHPNNHFGW